MRGARRVGRLAGAAWVAGGAWAVCVTLTVAALLLASANDPASVWTGSLASLVLVVYASVGALIASRRPGNLIGWLFCIGATVTAAGLLAQQSGHYALITRPGSLPGGVFLAWAGRWLTSLGFGLIINFLLLLFPDGRLPSPGWRPLGWLAAVTIGLTTVVYMLLPGSLARGRTDFSEFAEVQNPFGLASAAGVLDALANVGVPIVSTAVAVVGLAAVIVRFRRGQEEERQQLKWFAFAVAVLVVVLAVVLVLFVSGSNAGSELWYLGIVGIPVATGIAILKYRLYDIDLLINRALVYGGLTTGILGIYVLVVGYLGALFPTGGNSVISLVATAIVAILFQPLRQRLQRGVNRLLYGQRDEPYAVLSRLGQRLEAALAPEAVLPTIVQTVREALKLPYVAIALRQDDVYANAAGSGVPAPEPLRVPLVYQGETLGELRLAPRAPGEPFSPADRRLLDDLARQAGVAVHAVRLTADLQRSRERLVSAREEERRRLRRDLHDGLGAQLAALNLQAGALRSTISGDPTSAELTAVELQTELRSAIANIRRLVHDLRPPALDELGLLAALRAHAAQYAASGGTLAKQADLLPDGQPVQVEVDGPEHLPALPAAVEVAIYRIVQEALTNVVRHARARNCVVRLMVADEVCLAVADDGVGLPPAGGVGVGMGLLSMRERAAELGGTCIVRTGVRGGTEVLVRLPLPKE